MSEFLKVDLNIAMQDNDLKVRKTAVDLMGKVGETIYDSVSLRAVFHTETDPGVKAAILEALTQVEATRASRTR